MLTAQETEKVMEKFFNECFRFWKSTNLDASAAFENALQDVKRLKHDPYVPAGDLLNEEAKNKFVHYREIDLGR